MTRETTVIAYPDSTSTDYIVVDTQRSRFEEIARTCRADAAVHRRMLSSVTPSSEDYQPLVYIKTRPRNFATESSFQHGSRESWRRRYNELAEEVSDLQLESERGIDDGTIATARNVLKELATHDFAPPAISRLGFEAVVMLWVHGKTRYALTVTDGEIGFVVREPGKTLKRDHSLELSSIDLLRLT